MVCSVSVGLFRRLRARCFSWGLEGGMMWMIWGGEGYVGVVAAVMSGLVVWLVGPLAAPGIPRSLRSRPFRRTKGAYASELLGFGGLGCV